MKKLLVLAATVALVSACKKDTSTTTTTTSATAETPSLAQKALSFLGAAAFEGEIRGDVSSKAWEGKRQVTWSFKGDKVRYELPAGTEVMGGWILFDGGTRKMYMVNDQQKTFMTIDPDQTAAKTANPAEPPQIEKTGKHEVIAGYGCEDWNIMQKGKKSEACITDGLAFSFGNPRETAGDWTQTLAKEKRFPLRMVRYDATGAEEMRVEVTKVETKLLDASKFEVPAGYKEMSIASLLGGLGAPAGSGLPPGIKLPPGMKLPNMPPPQK